MGNLISEFYFPFMNLKIIYVGENADKERHLPGL